MKRIVTPFLHNEFLFRLSRLGKRHDQNLKILHGFTNKVIAQRKALLMGQVNASGSLSSDEDASIGKEFL